MNWRTVSLALLIGAAIAAAAFAFYNGRAEFGDEGSFCTIAQGVLSGRLPYRDLFNEKPPLQYFWTAAVMAFAGPTLASARIASALALALTVGCIVLGPFRRRAGALAVLGTTIAAAAVAIRLEAYRNTADGTLALFYALTAVLITRTPLRARNAALVGALQGVALGFRQTAGASAFVLFFAPGTKGARGALAGGLVVGVLAWLVPLAANGLLADFVRATILFHVGNSGASGYLGNGVDHWSSLFVWGLLMAAAAVSAGRSRGARVWALVWLVVLTMAYVGRKEEFRLWPSAAAALAMLAWQAQAAPARSFALGGRATALLLAGAALIAGVSAAWRPPPRRVPVQSVAEALKRITGPRDEIWAGPFSPYVYCLSERPSASRYYFVLPWTAKPEVRAEILRDLRARQPVIVIDRSSRGFDIDRLLPGMEEILTTRYQAVAPADSPAPRFTIYRPNPSAAPRSSADPVATAPVRPATALPERRGRG